MRNTVLTGIIITIVLLSCKAQKASVTSASQDTGTSLVSLDTSKWWLAKIHQPGGITEVKTRRAFIRFNEAKGSAGGNGSCNSFGSTMKIEGNSVSFTNIFSTKMYCEEVQSVENSFLDQLQKVQRYEIKDNSLLLFDREKLVLEFIK